MASYKMKDTCLCSLMLLMKTNQNITAAQKELLLWHCRLCHADYDWVQGLMKLRNQEIGVTAEPLILNPKSDRAARCDKPMCCGCQLAEQTAELQASFSDCPSEPHSGTAQNK